MIRNMYQYLDKEKLHYLAELCDEDGVLGENYFGSTEEFLDYVKTNDVEYVGKIDAELMVTELLTKEIRIEYDKENGEGSYAKMQNKINNELIEEFKKIVDEINNTNCGDCEEE